MIYKLCTAGHHMRLLTTKLSSTYNKLAYLPPKGARQLLLCGFSQDVGYPTSYVVNCPSSLK